MVERIIDKILRGITVDQLFISTFTVKAAGELKERLEKKISQALQQATHNDLKTYLNEQLLALQTADIGTMDAFTQKLVNQYGYTLGISPTFRIMTDKSEQDLVKNDVFADLFADYMTGQKQDIFRKLVRNFLAIVKIPQLLEELFTKSMISVKQRIILRNGWLRFS